MLKFFFLLVLFISSLNAKTIHFSGVCRIYDEQGLNLIAFPGKRCLFLEDGRMFSLGKNSLKSYSGNTSLIWEMPVSDRYSHATFSNDKKKIQLVTVSVSPDKKEFSVLLYVLSLEGEILQYRALTDIGVAKDYKGIPPQMVEIPKVANGPEWMKEGNYLYTGNPRGILVFSHDLKQILHTIKVPTSLNQDISEVSVSPEGKILYLNRFAKECSMQAPASTLEEMDPSTGKVTFRYPEIPHALFFIPVGGSVQSLDSDVVLANHPMTGLFVISKKNKRIMRYMRTFHFDKSGLRPPEVLRSDDLANFLKNWKF